MPIKAPASRTLASSKATVRMATTWLAWAPTLPPGSWPFLWYAQPR